MFRPGQPTKPTSSPASAPRARASRDPFPIRLPRRLDEDLDRFADSVAAVLDGTLSEDVFRAQRVPMGIYLQRDGANHLIRVRLPAGGLLPSQARAVAAISGELGNGVLHTTTRQAVQIHGVALEDLHPALVALADAGLTARGAGGNTVRNVTACPLAGVCSKECFDVTSYATEVASQLADNPLSLQLPRKYKIAFSGCADDCVGAAFNDLGFVATTRDGQPGFRVLVGGGMGGKSRVAHVLAEFVSVDQAPRIAEAIARVFDRHGNRRNRNKARIRFLVKELGVARFETLVRRELGALDRGEEGEGTPFPAAAPTSDTPPLAGVPTGEFARWRQQQVEPQRQAAHHVVHIPLRLGDIPAGTLTALAGVVEDHGERLLRLTPSQNLTLRWVHERELRAVQRELSAIGLGQPTPAVVSELVACAGAATCTLGICRSRPLATAITEELDASELPLEKLPPVGIRLSGCPDACSRHPVADIGLFGAARRLDGQLVPHYVLQLGGGVAPQGARLASGDDAIPARRVPGVIRGLLAAFLESPDFPDFRTFVDGEGRDIARSLARSARTVSTDEERRALVVDWGADRPFSLEGRGPGECGAGIFDLIEVDLRSGREALADGRLAETTVQAARALLVTRGHDEREAGRAIELFEETFLHAGLVDARFASTLAATRTWAAGSADQPEPALDRGQVEELLAAVERLYEDMDDSLRFVPAVEDPADQVAEPSADADAAADRSEDFRGVVCPLNYVKTKMVLGQMTSGAVLSVLLDEAGARNVPESVTRDGYEVLSLRAQPEGSTELRIRA